MAEEGKAKNDLERLEELARDAAVGSTMYDKRWVIENILTVGRHFQKTNYMTESGVKELEDKIEEKMMTLWDISVEEDVSKFYFEYGVLEFFIELFANPNLRVKEISMGIISNMVYHESIFKGIMEKDRCLESILKLLEEKDSPTLLIVFRCLHSYGFNLFHLINSCDDDSKEESKSLVNKFLIFLSIQSVVQNIGMVLGSCTNSSVLQNCARFLSILSELWDFSDERKKMVQHYTEDPFLACALEGVKECLGSDKTEKHFMVFLYLLFERDLATDVYSSISTQTISILCRLLKEHVLEYSSIDESDLEFVFNICFVLKCCLESGEYTSIPTGLKHIIRDVNDAMEKTEVDDEHAENKNSILCLLKRLANFLQSCNQNGLNHESTPGGGGDDSTREGDASPYFRTPRDTPRSARDTPGRSPWSTRTPGTSSPATWRTPR